MHHGISGKHSNPYEKFKNWIDEWFASKEVRYYWDGIHHKIKRAKRITWNTIVALRGASDVHFKFTLIWLGFRGNNVTPPVLDSFYSWKMYFDIVGYYFCRFLVRSHHLFLVSMVIGEYTLQLAVGLHFLSYF